jgi:hypothetical protein
MAAREEVRFRKGDLVRITQGPHAPQCGRYDGIAGPNYCTVRLGPQAGYREVTVPKEWMSAIEQEEEMIVLPRSELYFLLGKLTELTQQISEIRTRILLGARNYNDNMDDYNDEDEE